MGLLVMPSKDAFPNAPQEKPVVRATNVRAAGLRNPRLFQQSNYIPLPKFKPGLT